MGGRIVITGGGGQVGRFLAAQAARRGHEAVALTSAQWDITDPRAGREFVEPGDVVVNCAAFTAVDAAESEPDRAHAVNAVGAGHVAHTCADAGARLIHLSTDFVFGAGGCAAPYGAGGGAVPYDVDDVPAPMNVYGQTKLAGERAVRAALPDAHVVRTAWLYSGTGADFVAAMVAAARGTDPVDVVADQIGCPTYVVDLVAALLAIAAGGVDAGLLHAVNAGSASRFEQAQAVFAELGADPGRVRPVTSDRHPRPAPRPAFSVLSTVGSTAAGLTPLRPWRLALAAALRVL